MDHFAEVDDTAELPVGEFTRREFDVFKLISEGLRPRHIAEKLFISPGTVNTHCKNITTKLGVDSMTRLIERATECHKQEKLP